tara:strand:- start:4302 stop:4763 length:462 start_codon:yes stop_codon:yes gene_type:complete
MNSDISNLSLYLASEQDSFYKTIDDYIYDKTYKKIYDNKFVKNNNISGVKSHHAKYFDKNYNKEEKNLELKANLSKINDNISVCSFDYSNQMKNILDNDNLISQIPGYTKNISFYNNFKPNNSYRNINFKTIQYNSKYKNKTIPLPVGSMFYK